MMGVGAKKKTLKKMTEKQKTEKILVVGSVVDSMWFI